MVIDQLITLWNPVEQYLSDTNEIKKLRILMDTIDTAPSINIFRSFYYLYGFCSDLLILLFFSGLKTSFWNYFLWAFMGSDPSSGRIYRNFSIKIMGSFSNKGW